MAGKPGRSGGARPGAGRKPSPPTLNDAIALTKDPKAFLTALMNDAGSDMKLRADAAKALMPFVHQKVGEAGKKDDAAEKAKQASAGRFAPKAPPKLVVSNG
jgi:phage terminase small subunit